MSLTYCPVCAEAVYSDEPHVGPYPSQAVDYRFAHEECAYKTDALPSLKADQWCSAAFGPVSYEDDVGARAYACRLWKGHKGPHDCQAARDAGIKDEPAIVRPKPRSAAARALFG